MPTHKKPLTDKQFGEYLAGMIEGDGWIVNTKKGSNICIVFHSNDASVAYYIKKRLGYGKVRQVKDKRAVVYAANKLGTLKIAELINGKLRTEKKIDKFNLLLEWVNKHRAVLLIPQEKDTSKLTDSYWLAGFTDADGSFQIKTLNRKERKLGFEIRLSYQVDQISLF